MVHDLQEIRFIRSIRVESRLICIKILTISSGKLFFTKSLTGFLLIPQTFFCGNNRSIAPTLSIGIPFKRYLKERSSDTIYPRVFEQCAFVCFLTAFSIDSVGATLL